MKDDSTTSKTDGGTKDKALQNTMSSTADEPDILLLLTEDGQFVQYSYEEQDSRLKTRNTKTFS